MAEKTSLDEAVELAERVLKDGLLGLCGRDGATGEEARPGGDLVLFLDFGLEVILEFVREQREYLAGPCCVDRVLAVAAAKERGWISENPSKAPVAFLLTLLDAAEAFHKVAVKERDLERARADRLEEERDDARRAWCKTQAYQQNKMDRGLCCITPFEVAERRWGVVEARRLFGEGGSGG